MERNKVYADGFTADFWEQNSLLDFLKERQKNSWWKVFPTKLITVSPLKESTFEGRQYDKEELKMMIGIFQDTMQNTQLLMEVGDQKFPVRSCAVKSLLDRAKISGNALKKVDRAVFAQIVNDCLRVAKGDSLIRIADGKVSAVHSGNPKDYSALDMAGLFEKTADYLQVHYRAKYICGSYEHALTTALWDLSEDKGLFKSYERSLRDHGIYAREIRLAVRFSPSDTGMNSAGLYPMIRWEGQKNSLPLGDPLRLKHRNGADIQDFETQLNQLYSQYQYALGKLEKLLDITVEYPADCMKHICDKTGMSKKLTAELVSTFAAQNGNAPCSAHDVYCGISEAAFLLQCDGASEVRVAQMEENIARAMALNWKEYDYPEISGEVCA